MTANNSACSACLVQTQDTYDVSESAPQWDTNTQTSSPELLQKSLQQIKPFHLRKATVKYIQKLKDHNNP